jgi:hypothetical protein
MSYKLLIILLLFKEISIVYQRDGNGDKLNRVSGSASGLKWAKPLLNFVANNFLPVGNLIIYSPCYKKNVLFFFFSFFFFIKKIISLAISLRV